MNKVQGHKYRFKWLFILLFFSTLVFVLTRMGVHNPTVVECWYSQGVYPHIARALNLLSNLFPFSLDDLFYGCLMVMLLVNTILLISRRLKLLHYFKRLLTILALVYCLFNVLWGFNYYRANLNQRLNLKAAKADVHQLMTVFEELVAEVNTSYTPIYTIDQSRVLRCLMEQYRQEAGFLKVDASCHVIPKHITLSRFFAAATISGYYGPFAAEVHLNKYLLPHEVPVVMAHEMAHRLGITSEAEANFYAWYICSKSDDKRLAYSANLYLLRYFVYECYKYEGFSDLVKQIRYEVRHDFYKSHFHWMTLMNRNVELVATKVNDAYLKSNNVEAGIADYDGVIKHVMDYRISE
jgi:hypothetical protein